MHRSPPARPHHHTTTTMCGCTHLYGLRVSCRSDTFTPWCLKEKGPSSWKAPMPTGEHPGPLRVPNRRGRRGGERRRQAAASLLARRHGAMYPYPSPLGPHEQRRAVCGVSLVLCQHVE